MRLSSKTTTKAATAGLVFVAAVIFGVLRMHGALATGEEGLRVWFYDLSQQRPHAVSRNTIPPHAGIGGEAGDGVRAIVVVCRSEPSDPDNRRIAYLETYSPELKRVLEDIRAARAAGREYGGELQVRDGDFFQENTLVRRRMELTWHTIASPEGQRIMADWRTWSCGDGQSPIVCVP